MWHLSYAKLGVSRTPKIVEMATKVEADPLYSRLNARGRKELKPSGKNALAERFSDYAGLGLPAHKAAMDGSIECLKEVYRSMHNVGVPSRDVNGATALHLAVRSNKVEAVKLVNILLPEPRT